MIVSIIIPVYNRADLIGETLDSIIAQSYSYWECLVVDDGSTDTTTNVVAKYVEVDSRIKLFIRPNTKPKGANACRNIGLNQVQGNYVIFFDSDDLMTENHVEVKISAIKEYNCDYVITKTQYFNYNNEVLNSYYNFDKFPITPFNYVGQNINWLTLDICVKTQIVQNIKFNEKLQSGQEYNYFSKLVHKSTNAAFVNEVVSLRRYHERSIQFNLNSGCRFNSSQFHKNWLTYLDLKPFAEKKVLNYLMTNCIKLIYEMKTIPDTNNVSFIKETFNAFSYKGVYFILMHIGRRYFSNGYFFRQLLVNN